MGARLPSCLYLCWLTLTSVLLRRSTCAEAVQRATSPFLGSLHSEFTMEGKVQSVHESLSTLPGSRR